jgi:hypothetical protein
MVTSASYPPLAYGFPDFSLSHMFSEGHYQALILMLVIAQGRRILRAIDYDTRERGTTIESDVGAALSEVDRLARQVGPQPVRAIGMREDRYSDRMSKRGVRQKDCVKLLCYSPRSLALVNPGGVVVPHELTFRELSVSDCWDVMQVESLNPELLSLPVQASFILSAEVRGTALSRSTELIGSA